MFHQPYDLQGSADAVGERRLPGTREKTPQSAAAASAFNVGTVVSYAAINGLLALASLLPWERLGLISASGLDVTRGWVVLAMALLAGGLACLSLALKRGLPGLRLLQFLSAAAALGMAAIEVAVIANACSGSGSSSFGDFCLRPTLGMGAVLAGLGGLGLGLLALFSRVEE